MWRSASTGRRQRRTTPFGVSRAGLLSDCDRRIEHFLQVLVAIERQAAAGPLTTRQRADLEASLSYFATAAPKHTADEEENLFPRLRASSDAAAVHALEAVDRLERDHDEADRRHRDVDTIGRRWLERGALGHADAHDLREHLSALQAIYDEHIAIEDGELFPAAARLLSPSEVLEIGREMAARRIRT